MVSEYHVKKNWSIELSKNKNIPYKNIG